MAAPLNEIVSRTSSEKSPTRMEEGVEREAAAELEENLKNSPTYTRKVLAEFLATYLFIFIGCGSEFANRDGEMTIVGIALAWSLALMAVIYTVGHISGAHFNPAVTIAFAATSRFPWKQVPLYVLAQVASASLASFSLRWLHKGSPAELMLTLPADTVPAHTAMAWEIVASALLMWVKCGVATDDRAIKELQGASVAAVLFGDIIVAGRATGASMNPARSIGPAIATQNFHKIWIYIVAPVIGTIIGAFLYELLRQPNKCKTKKLGKTCTGGK